MSYLPGKRDLNGTSAAVETGVSVVKIRFAVWYVALSFNTRHTSDADGDSCAFGGQLRRVENSVRGHLSGREFKLQLRRGVSSGSSTPYRGC